MANSWYIFFTFLLCSATVGFADTPQTEIRKNLRRLARANNDMALNLYKQIASSSSDNIFFSPLSLSTVFGMLYYGSRGHTAEELSRTLGYEAAGLQDELVHRTFQHYLTQILPSQDPSAYVLNSANAILVDKHLDLVSSYKTDVQDFYQALVQDVDFLTQAPQIVEEINDWARQKTNGKIDNLLGRLDPSSLLVLLNAVYFKGTWETQFDPRNTSPGTFYNNGQDSEAKQVPMMTITDYFHVAYDSDLRTHAIEMPYKGEHIIMVLLLPEERDGLHSLERSLTLEKMASFKQQKEETRIYLSMPKFKIEYSKEMSPDFKSLGAKSIFSPGADFSGITSNPNVVVNQIIHKAVIEVNEEGSEAAAVSVIHMYPTSAISSRSVFIVDRPFTFAIVDTRNDMILFAGRVTNL